VKGIVVKVIKPVRRTLVESAEFTHVGNAHARLAVLEKTYPYAIERFEIWVTLSGRLWYKNGDWTFLTEAGARATLERMLPSYVGS